MLHIEPPVKTDVQSRQLDSIPSVPMHLNREIQSNAVPTAVRHTHIDDFQDDELLCDFDIDQITSTATTNTSTEASIEPNPSNRSLALLDDDMDDDFLCIDTPTMELENRNQQVQLELRPMQVDIDEARQSDAPIWDEKYRFKIRGINLATIKQLNECSAENRLQRKHFLIKAEIDSVIGNECIFDFLFNLFDFHRDFCFSLI